MQYRTIPKTGERISALGYGCMRFPTRNGNIDEEKAIALLMKAIQAGVNYLDTAVPYHAGRSEPFLGRALSGGLRDKVKLATKLPHWNVRSRADMDAALGAQLGNLMTERIDYYLVHNLQGSSWDRIVPLGITGFLDEAKASGKIRYAGFSFHGMREDFKRIVDAYDWDFCQIQYNFLDTENQAGTEGLEYAAYRGLGVIVMEPLRGGNLAGQVPEKVRAIWSRAEVTRTPAEWALRWIWNRPEVTTVLSGMTYESHLEENLRVVEDALPGSLSEFELSLVEEAAAAYRSLMKAGCTGCQYCMPCPAGVNIPAVFEYYNGSSLFGHRLKTLANYAINLGGVLGAKPSGASLCVRCGKCLKVCPQYLPIPDLLEQARRQFEGPLGKSLAGLAKFGLGLQASLSRLTRPRAGRGPVLRR